MLILTGLTFLAVAIACLAVFVAIEARREAGDALSAAAMAWQVANQAQVTHLSYTMQRPASLPPLPEFLREVNHAN